jgi:hypothetical protein
VSPFEPLNFCRFLLQVVLLLLPSNTLTYQYLRGSRKVGVHLRAEKLHEPGVTHETGYLDLLVQYRHAAFRLAFPLHF